MITITLEKKIANHKRMFIDYNRFKDLQGRYNAGKIEGEVFTLYRLKDNSVIAKFNIKTFQPVD